MPTDDTNRALRRIAHALVALAVLMLPSAALGVDRDTVGLVDPSQGIWYLQAEDGMLLVGGLNPWAPEHSALLVVMLPHRPETPEMTTVGTDRL